MLSSLRTFLDSHRTEKDADDWNLTGIGSKDMGKYRVDDEEYDIFLKCVHDHIFGPKPQACSLLEKHRDVGPLLIDLDFRYASGGPLVRRFNHDMIKKFVAEYMAAIIYFSEMENFKADAPPANREIRLFYLTKPSPETEKGNHKDGVHIQCPDIVTSPKFQYAVRGFLLGRGTVGSVFESTAMTNIAEDVYDVSVIHRNNWFLYGACKPDKAQYSVNRVWKILPDDVREALDGNVPGDFDELVDVVYDMMEESEIPTDNWELLKTLSIRRGISVANSPSVRTARQKEWDDLVAMWGSGKAKLMNARQTAHVTGPGSDEEPIVSTIPNSEDGRRITSEHSAEDIALAYRLARQCLNAERRAGEYTDWVNLAICLKNIANTDESFHVWCEITRRVDPAHKKARMTDAELRAKWNLVRCDSTKRLTMGSLQYWAKDDSPKTWEAIQSETLRDWIMNFAKDTHVNVATCVMRMYGHEFRCSYGAKRAGEWFQFVDHAWKHLRTPTVLRARLSNEVRNHYIEADREFGRRITLAADAERQVLEEKRKGILKIETQLENASFKDNVLKECTEKFYDEDFVSHLNCNPYLVGVANGVLDLQHMDESGRPSVVFREGRPDDYVSFLMGRSEPDFDAVEYIPYDVNSQDQKDIMAFFERIYPDPILRRYVLTLLASCLEGQNREQRFYVNQGRGSNGKSMIQTLMRYTFGDYQTSLQTTALTRKRPESGAANPDMIVTKCKRYIYMGEPDQNEKLNTARMKQLSGEDIVEARGLFADQEKFKMMGKIFLSCNDLPPVSSMDNGTWRRLRVIPHVATFVDPDKPANPAENIFPKDLHLEHKLRKWRVAFLSLLVHYYQTEYLAHGLREPESVMVASNKYKEENDTFYTFVQENFVLEPGAGPVRIGEVVDIYKEWKKSQFGRAELKKKEISDRLREVCDRKSTDREFWGIRRLELDEEEGGSILSAGSSASALLRPI
jgi:P4 family phage/plasmid primase-like protien